MLVAYPWLLLFAMGWIVGAIFVGAVGGATRGVQGFFAWLLLALMFFVAFNDVGRLIGGERILP